MSGTGKISTMTVADPIDGTEALEVLQIDDNVKVTLNSIRTDLRMLSLDADDNVIEGTSTIIPSVDSYTSADFLDAGFDLTLARHVIVSNWSNETGYGGTLWEIDPTATSGKKRILRDPYVYFATLAAAPAPGTIIGLRIKAGDFGLGNGELLIDNGTRYRPAASDFLIGNLSAPIVRTTSLETEEVMYSVILPRDVSGNSIFQNNDRITIREATLSKTGTTDTMTGIIRFGTAGTTSDTSILSTGPSAVGNLTLGYSQVKFSRTDATTLQKTGIDNPGPVQGFSNTAHSSTDTVTSIDSAPMYLNICGKLTKSGGSLVDTALTLQNAEIVFTKGF